MKLKIALGLFSAAGALLIGDVAQAEQVGKWYGRVAGGYTFPNNVTLDSYGAPASTFPPGVAVRLPRAKINGGFTGDLAVGYNLLGSVNRTTVVRTELMFGYNYNKINDNSLAIHLNGVPNSSLVGLDTKIQSFSGLANVYFDLIEWHRFVPYVGFGLGVSANKIDSSTFKNPQNIGGLGTTAASISGRTEFNLAWQLTAGTGYRLTNCLTGEIFYRYMNLGKIKSGTASNVAAVTQNVGGFAGNLNSHSVSAGLRYNF